MTQKTELATKRHIFHSLQVLLPETVFVSTLLESFYRIVTKKIDKKSSPNYSYNSHHGW